MVKRLMLGLALLGAVTLSACTQSPATAPAPVAPPAAASDSGSNAVQSAPAAGQPSSAQPAAPSSGTITAEEAVRGQVIAPPKNPSTGLNGEIRPTTVPDAVVPLGPATTSKDRVLYARGGNLWVASADGKEHRKLLPDDAPAIWSPPKDPGRVWISPSNRQIMYIASPSGSMVVVDIDGKNLRQVLDNATPKQNSIDDRERQKVERKLIDQEVAWSPDESKVAFVGAPNGQVDLYMLDLQTGKTTQVTNDVFQEDLLTWSPKGDALFFKGRDDPNGQEKAFVLRGSQVTEIPSDKIAGTVGERVLGGVLAPGWYDNDRVFFYPTSANLTSLGLWMYDLRDGSLTPLVKDVMTTPIYDKTNRRWAYVGGDAKTTLFVLDGPGAQPKAVVQEKAEAPIWTPNGKQIVYSSDNGQMYDIHVVNVDGSNDKALALNVNLIADNPANQSPAGKRFFSPDGKLLVYTAAGADYGMTGDNLENWWAVPLDGSHPASPLTDIPKIFYVRQLSYSPDKDSFAFTGLRYADRTTHLWTASSNGGNIVKLDAEVRWYRWLDPTAAAKAATN
ncbi:MAG: hypothetical protein U0822_01040 [Anaerolineae bacterium]